MKFVSCSKNKGAYIICLITIVVLLMITVNLLLESHSKLDSSSITNFADFVNAYGKLEWPLSFREFPRMNFSHSYWNMPLNEVETGERTKPTIAYVFAGLDNELRTIFCLEKHLLHGRQCKKLCMS